MCLRFRLARYGTGSQRYEFAVQTIDHLWLRRCRRSDHRPSRRALTAGCVLTVLPVLTAVFILRSFLEHVRVLDAVS
jgi:hypothetical protein